MAYYPPPQQQYPPQQPYPPQRPGNTDSTGMILEIVFGLFGIMGMGWLYAGRIGLALLIFFGFWILLGLEALFSVITGGVCACAAFPINIGLAIWSGTQVRDYVRQHWVQGSIMNVIIAGIVGVLLVGGLIAGLIALFVALGLLGGMSSGY